MDEYDVQKHVSNVYSLVATMLCVYSAGAYMASLLLNYIVEITLISTITSFTFLISANFSKEPNKYYHVLMFALSLGFNSAYMIQYANNIDRSIIPISIVLTLGIFLIFSYMSKNIGEQTIVLLRCYLFSSLWGFIFVGFLFTLFPSTFASAEMLYITIGILMYCGFVTYDTALMYDRIRKGEVDYYFHAINLFLDIVNLFIKIIRFLAKLKTKKN
jgi:FtsH-binding integral membrane protein